MERPERQPPQPSEGGRPLDYERRRTEREEARQWYHMAGLGVEFIVAILMLGGLGYWLDGRWDTRPWLMLIGGGIGFALGMWLMLRAAMKAFND